MATRRSNTPSTARSTRGSSRGNMRSSLRDNMTGGSNDDIRNSAGGGMRGKMRDLARGIHVSAEMPDPKVARITIDIEWQSLAARFAHKVSRQIKKRVAHNKRSTRTTAPGRRSRG